MGDNVRLPGDGIDVATDELSTLNGGTAPVGLQVQRFKVGFGPDGDLTDVSSSDPLPVAMQGTTPVSVASLPLPSGAATDVGLAAVVAAINANGGGGGGGGSVSVSNFPATQTVAGTVAVSSLPLATGAATAAGQAAIVTALGSPLQAGGTVATVTTVGTVTTVTTVSTVTTVNTVSALTNQAQMGGFLSNNQIPALMNIAAASNIDRMVG